MTPRFIVQQKITALVNQYRVYEADIHGNKGNIIAFVQQKRFAFKEKVLFYADETKQEQLFSFRAEKVMDIHGKFFIEDTNGEQIGVFKKDFTKSLTSSTWHIIQNEQPTFTITEKNPTIAALRRYAGFIPIVGDIVDIAFAFIKYHFVFTNVESQQVVGEYIKTALFRDHYTLSMNDENYAAIDQRVLIAMAIALDALQAR